MNDHGEDPRPTRGAVREVYGVDRAATLSYSPDLDGLADPGEIVWAWVPYEEDPERGKDRPLLVVGRHKRQLLAMMLSSRGGDGDPNEWLEIGPGRWDKENRISYLRLDRVFALDEDDIRREGSILDGERFVEVALALKRVHGWSTR
ncbi:type II toxin-antitoxin system PemK/MazF family toxin [Streptosporangium subroseum]|uniref:type II toxin-antitoxin system PemK/MazF family toxin n=1 Tax=Streptosporangium subroseum TaxID=106412 RepID=UPI00308A78B7|nr:type II toxin-antitoxin system PemK/MazF family toxin [Streptosporangium subroseum]